MRAPNVHDLLMRISNRIWMFASHRIEIGGIKTYWIGMVPTAADIERFRSVVQLVDACNCASARYFRRYCRKVIVSQLNERSGALIGTDIMIQSWRHLNTGTLNYAAMMIVHESAHLRYARLNPNRRISQALTDSHERRAHAAELDLANHLSISESEQVYLDRWDPSDWNLEVLDLWREDQLRKSGAPEHAIRFHRWIRATGRE